MNKSFEKELTDAAITAQYWLLENFPEQVSFKLNDQMIPHYMVPLVKIKERDLKNKGEEGESKTVCDIVQTKIVFDAICEILADATSPLLGTLLVFLFFAINNNENVAKKFQGVKELIEKHENAKQENIQTSASKIIRILTTASIKESP